MSDEKVTVIIAETEEEAIHWRDAWKDTFPELENALIRTTEVYENVDGLRVHHLFVAPGATYGKEYDDVYKTLHDSVILTPGSFGVTLLGRR